MDRMTPIVYRCTGINEFGAVCAKTLFVFTPPLAEPIAGDGSKRADLGVIEMKCRRCKTLNMFHMGEYDTALRPLQVGSTRAVIE